MTWRRTGTAACDAPATARAETSGWRDEIDNENQRTSKSVRGRTMTIGAIDCDIHPGVPDIKALLPYMDEFWRESFVARGIDGFDMMSYPLNAPITCRPDWRVPGERPGSDLGNMQRDALDAFGISLAICNPLTGGQVAASESMGAAICSAVNDWIIEHWLNRDRRLRASIVIPAQAPLMAVEE